MADGHRVVVVPDAIELWVRLGESIMAAAQRAGYTWPTSCQGSAICTRCWIRVEPHERAHLTPMRRREEEALHRVRWRGVERPGERLACQASVVADTVVFKQGVRRIAGERLSGTGS